MHQFQSQIYNFQSLNNLWKSHNSRTRVFMSYVNLKAFVPRYSFTNESLWKLKTHISILKCISSHTQTKFSDQMSKLNA